MAKLLGPSHVPSELKKLRLRAKLSMAELAKSLGYKGSSSYQRFEDEELFKRAYLPFEIMAPLCAVLVGKGTPPIEQHEVTDLFIGPDALAESLDHFLNRGIGANDVSRTPPGELPAPARPRPARALYGASGTEASSEPPVGGAPLEALAAPALHGLAHDVPVRGTARGDNDGKGDFTFNGDVAGYVRRLPGLANVKGAFALYVQGSSMSPWREEGGLVYINPHRPARVGDHVVVEMRPTREGEPGIVWIKKLLARSGDGGLTLAQYNPPRSDIKLRGAAILQVLRVAEWEELVL